MLYYIFSLLISRVVDASNETNVTLLSVCCSGTCGSCGYVRESPCDSLLTCETQCSGTFCVEANITVHSSNSSCGLSTDFGHFSRASSIPVPSYLIRAPYNQTVFGRRLLASRQMVGVLRTMPFPIGTITAALTPGYDDGGGDELRAELIDTNNRVAALADTVAALANQTREEALLRDKADAVLHRMIESAENDLNTLKDQTQKGLQANTNSIILLTIGVDVAQQAAILLDGLRNNIELIRSPLTSPPVQKLLKIASLGEFDATLTMDFTPDVFTYVATSHLFAWANHGLVAMISNITVVRRPTALSYLLNSGDQYVYEVITTPITMSLELTTFPLPCATYGNCTSAQVTAFSTSWITASLTNNGAFFFQDPIVFNGTESGFGLGGCGEFYNSTDSTFTTIPIPSSSGCCQFFCLDNCIPQNTFRTCNNRLDILGARPTTLWLPDNQCSDPFITCYPSANPSTPWVLVDFQNLSTPYFMGSMRPHSTQFHDPIYVAKKYFPYRNFTIPTKARVMFESGNQQDNTLFGEFGNITDVPLGYLDGVTTPVVLDPTLFPSSYDIISWHQGSVPLAGWTPSSSCYISSADHMCCEGFPLGITLPFIQQQLGYILDDVPVSYQPRYLYDRIESITNAISVIIDLNSTNFSVPIELVNELADIHNQTVSLVNNLDTIIRTANNISIASKQANERIAALENSKSSISISGVLIVVILIAVVIAAACCCYFLRRPSSISPTR
jgi:hypothetical protein